MSRLFRDVAGGPRCPHGSVVCIGAFDGLHLGHQALVRHAVERARALGVPAVALSFEPLPREFFADGVRPPRLLPAGEKASRLLAMGLDQVGLLRFDAALSAMDAEDFVRQVLVQRLAAREVWVGPEFRFGRRRGGDIVVLRRLGAQLDFSAGQIDPVMLQGERVSSTRIREALTRGNLDAAARLLGRPYSLCGRVVRGRQLGRTLGYPTANIRFAPGIVPAVSGIFATRVHGAVSAAQEQSPEALVPPRGRHADGAPGWPSVSSVGTRPTVGGVEPLLETHLFDFDGDLYGRRLEVEFVAKLRDEEHFSDLPALAAQMHRDAEQARDLLSQDQRRVLA
ncbi:MAG: bifunctional riboflavin kinase/FAD synthetase [Pseudomonadota bacterium]|nr:bifunctional riboflavin kinase/FAD synthetase [Pseudomonadota bacterium]